LPHNPETRHQGQIKYDRLLSFTRQQANHNVLTGTTAQRASASLAKVGIESAGSRAARLSIRRAGRRLCKARTVRKIGRAPADLMILI
jgi:hypothetical protein